MDRTFANALFPLTIHTKTMGKFSAILQNQVRNTNDPPNASYALIYKTT